MFNTKKEMKAKLITDGKNNYSLLDYNNELIGTTMESMITDQKLPKQNCDEIFGVVNVEKLAEDHPLEVSNASHGFGIKDGIIYGFNKAMELNKDKVFTLRDVKQAIFNFANYDRKTISELDRMDMAIASIQQPTEIDVEIEMDDIWDGLDSTRIFPKEETSFPSLDPNGCLILKKI
jgi:ribosome-interacting GTPase 1